MYNLPEYQPPQWGNKVVRWFDDRLPIITLMHKELVVYPTPRNINYWWNFGSLAGIMLMIMILSGVFLAMFYVPHADHAFDSIERIMRDVNYGWLLRYIHMNGASMFFIVTYIHVFRGLYYGSYKSPREVLWWMGILILFLMIITAFLGYVLPWGQMSFWAATVISSMASAVPLIGEGLVQWLWGGFNVSNPTLNRFFSLHYLMPMVIFAVVFLHMWALHVKKSNNPLGIDIKGPNDTLPFHPYFTSKDAFGLGVFLMVFSFFIFFAPNFFGEVVNYVPADPMVTPPHIVPEWYFLPFYAILRAVPDKLGGVIAMVASILILFVLPWLDTSKVRSATFRPWYKIAFWVFFADCLFLGYLGAQQAEEPFVTLTQLATVYYFAHFLIIVPALGWFEKPQPLPESISAPVTDGGADATAASKA